MKDHTFETPDSAFHYIDWGGTGPLAHISHATGFNARTYSPLAERLAKSLHMIGLDDRGHGRTTAPADPKRLKDWGVFVKDLERFFESRGEPVVAMGHSRGGVASLMLAAMRPDLVRALVLIDPTILPYSWMWWWYLAKLFGQAKRVSIAARAARRKAVWPDRATIFNAYYGRGAFKEWTQGFLEGYLADGVVENGSGEVHLSCTPAWESRCFAVCNHDVWKYVPQPTVPVLVLYGKASDTFLPAAVQRYKRMAPKAEVIGLEGTGHFAPMEKPDQTTEVILDFLQRHDVLPKASE